ncbi:hypothetical protein E5E59_07580 [Helicobacter pylori]|nr:hypothetical protein E5E59_07580 [Helicobacter pylori]
MNIKSNGHSKIDEILVKGVDMRKGGLGGANTQTGIKFEEENDLVSRLKDMKGYRCEERSLGGYEIYFKDESIAYSFKKHELY